MISFMKVVPFLGARSCQPGLQVVIEVGLFSWPRVGSQLV